MIFTEDLEREMLTLGGRGKVASVLMYSSLKLGLFHKGKSKYHFLGRGVFFIGKGVRP